MEKDLTEESRRVGWALFGLAIAVGDLETARGITEDFGEPMPCKRIELMHAASRARGPIASALIEERYLRIPIVEKSVPTVRWL